MKRTLRRIPGLVTTYRHAQILTAIAYERWWADRQLMNDRSILNAEWNFEASAEQERHRSALAAVTARRGPVSWGDVLEIGCAEGLFTAQLVQRSASVTAYDVSAVACERTARRLPQVRVQRLNIERDAIPGVFDIVFVMDVLGYVHGRDQLRPVSQKLAGALRRGGLLVFTDQRLHLPQMENCWWARWLVEGGLQLLTFLDGRQGLQLAYQELHPRHVIGIYEKRV